MDSICPCCGQPVSHANIKHKEYTHIMETWNTFAKKHGLREIKKLNTKRLEWIKSKLREPDFDLDAILAEAELSRFLLGKSGENWKISFDFIFERATRWLDILEGKYFKPDEPKASTDCFF